MTRYLGGLITKDESLVIPANNFEDTSAPGIWTLEEAQMLAKQSLWPTAGVSNPAKFVENIFSIDTFFDSNAAADGAGRTITNGIDLAGEGGLVWVKSRTSTQSHSITDTVNGAGKALYPDLTYQLETTSTYDRVSQFNNNGFVYTNGYAAAQDYVAWTFRKAPKFLDVVQYSGTGSARTVSHSLGAVPGMIIIKNVTLGTDNWAVYHRAADSSAPEDKYLILNTNAAVADSADWWNDTAPTSSVFTVGTDHSVNASGENYIAYIFGHDTSDEGMIQCGTFDTNASQHIPAVNLGFEPQWLMVKQTNAVNSWYIVDTLREYSHSATKHLRAEADGAEETWGVPYLGVPVPTGFDGQELASGVANGTFIYVAIRKGPMKTPTSRASVFEVAYGTGAAQGTPNYRTTFPIDMAIHSTSTDSDGSGNNAVQSRMTGLNFGLYTNTDSVENNYTIASERMDYTNGFNSDAGSGTIHQAAMWRRAPGFFDVVAYTGTGSARTVNHNLGVAPEMIWCKSRETVLSSNDWFVYHKNLPTPNDDAFTANNSGDIATGNGTLLWNSTAPTSTVFSLGTYNGLNQSGKDYIAFLWATLAGISKVGSFSHTNGSSTDVDCGFSSGSRWIIVRRIDSGINNDAKFYLWNGLTGIVSGNDSYFQLNNNDAIVSNTDLIDPLDSGFQMASGFTTGDYIFYAIAA